MVRSLWEQREMLQQMTELEELVYRSNLLGTDRTVCNWGGGNTSCKTVIRDFRGRETEVMYVKGSGSDLATMKAVHFTGLRLDDIRPLFERESMSDEEMVAYLAHCMVDAKQPRASIETLLHAFLPYPHVDHTHPDAIISICCADNGREIAEELFGERMVWVPYIRPGFELSKRIAEGVRSNPKAELVLMEKHGLVTWGATSKASYAKTIAVINEAEAYIEKYAEQRKHELFGGWKHEPLPEADRRTIASQIMPAIRGAVGEMKKAIVTFDDEEDVLQFVGGHDSRELARIGAACPDHLVHTKPVPLVIDWEPNPDDTEGLRHKLLAGIAAYKDAYESYFRRNRNDGDVLSDSSPRVILVPGLGMFNTGKSWAMSKLSGDLYHRAIAVMKGATALGRFVSLTENEAYNIEYWPLELYKLTLAPPEAEFSRSVAFITGGAGGIGSETARRLAAEGAHVVLADLNIEGAKKAAAELNEKYGANRAIAVRMDVTNEEEITAAYSHAALTYGGVDIVVNNAGLATSSPFDETTLKEWSLNINVLGTGHMEFELAQRTGGSIRNRAGPAGGLLPEAYGAAGECFS